MGNTNSCFGKAAGASRDVIEVHDADRHRGPQLHRGDYSLLAGIGVGKFVSSTTFSVGGRNWNIRFYPEGDGREPGYASAFLHLVGPAAGATTGVKAKFTLSLLGKDGKVYRELKPVSIAPTFETAGVKSSWGVIKFVEKAALQEAGCFTIRCDLTVLKDAVVQKM